MYKDLVIHCLYLNGVKLLLTSISHALIKRSLQFAKKYKHKNHHPVSVRKSTGCGTNCN